MSSVNVALIGTQFSDVGSVRVFSGADGALLHSWVGSLGHVDLFGYAVCGAGDVDGDGHHDVLVSSGDDHRTPLAEGAQGDLVAHGARGDEQGRLLAYASRERLLEPVEGRVFAIDVVADDRVGHGSAQSS